MPRVLGVFVGVLGIIALGGQRAAAPRSFNTVVNLETTSEDSANVSMGDLDGDGDLEIVVNGRRGQVYAFHHDGTNVTGWPQLTEPVIVSPPALGDLDGDGLPEVIAGTSTVQETSGAANYLYAWHGDGTRVAGWPVRHPEYLNSTFFGFGTPAIADLEGDGTADVFASSDSTYRFEFALNGLHPDGSRLRDFPRPTKAIGTSETGSPAIADVDGDGLLEMAWLDSDKRLYLWDFDAPVSASLPWPMYRGDAGHRGRIGSFQIANRPPLAEAGLDRTIELGSLAVLDATASSDPDGDPLTFLWTDSAANPVGNQPVISLGLTLGTHRFYLTVSDPKGAASSDFVDIAVVDTTPPTVELVLPVGGPVPEGRPLAIEWTAADIGQLSRFDLFSSSDGGGSYAPIAGCSGLPPTARVCTWPSPGPAALAGRLRVVAFDASGNQNGDEVEISILPVRSVSIRIAARKDDVEENPTGGMALGQSDLDFSARFVGLRFVNVPVPRGATILGARVDLIARATVSAATTLTIRGQASDDASPFSTTSRNLTSRPLTSASVPWNPSPWIVRTVHATPDITSIVQEIVSRGGWQSGRALVLSFARGSGRREAFSADHGMADAPVLLVEYMDSAP